MVESQHIEDDGMMYGEDVAGDHVFLHDADMLDQPELYFGAEGMQPASSPCRPRAIPFSFLIPSLPHLLLYL